MGTRPRRVDATRQAFSRNAKKPFRLCMGINTQTPLNDLDFWLLWRFGLIAGWILSASTLETKGNVVSNAPARRLRWLSVQLRLLWEQSQRLCDPLTGRNHLGDRIHGFCCHCLDS